MALSIPPGIFDSTVDLMAMSLAEVGDSVGELLEVGGLDGMELGSRETAWLCGLWKTKARVVPTAITIFITKPAILTDGFFKKPFPLLVHLFLFIVLIGDGDTIIYLIGQQDTHLPQCCCLV